MVQAVYRGLGISLLAHRGDRRFSAAPAVDPLSLVGDGLLHPFVAALERTALSFPILSRPRCETGTRIEWCARRRRRWRWAPWRASEGSRSQVAHCLLRLKAVLACSLAIAALVVLRLPSVPR